MYASLFHYPNHPNLEQHIKDTFYNSIVDFVLNLNDVTRENLPQLLQNAIRHTIQTILNVSKSYNGIRLPVGLMVTMDNCPEKYQPLFALLLSLKSGGVQNAEQIDALITQVMQLDSFQELNPSQFLLEAKGLTSPIHHQVQYEEKGITPDLIRDTFYNEMVTQTLLAIDNQWLTPQELLEEDPRVYFVLPALTLFEAIQQSQRCEGIRLLENKVINAHNCPQVESFPLLMKLLLTVKVKIAAMSEQQLLVVKHLVSCDKDLPEHLQAIKTPKIMASVAIIKDMAIEITRGKVFHKMIGLVLKMCLDTLPPVSQSSISNGC
jgi:hypothetical protein